MSSLVGGLFGTKPKNITAPSQYEQAPDFVQEALQNLFSQGQQVAGTTSPFAPPPINQYTQAALNQIGSGPPAMGFMKGAQNAFGQASNFLNGINPQIGMSNGFLNAASGNIAQGTNPITAQMIGGQATDLMNPFTSNVIDILKGYSNDNLADQLSQNNSNSTLAGAFGSNRAALEGGQIRLANNRAFNESAGGLLNNAYQTASQQALENLTNERNRFLQGANINLGQSQGALGGANAFANAAGAATDLGRGNLQGSAQNVANYNNQISQLSGGGDYLSNYQMQQNQVPLQQLKLLQSLLSTYGPLSGAGQSTAYNPQQYSGSAIGNGLTAFSGLKGLLGGLF